MGEVIEADKIEFYKLNGTYNTNCIKYNTGSGLWYSYYGDKWNYVGN